MKILTQSTYANLYLDAANQLGMQYRITNKKKATAFIFNENKRVRLVSHKLRLNESSSIHNAIHKAKTSALLLSAHIPVPGFAVFTYQNQALRHALKQLYVGLKIVIKPSAGSNAIGIKVNPTTTAHVKQAIALAFKDSPEIIVEDYILGHHYRITVMDNEIIAVTQRIPAYVLGDGIHTVLELIDVKNTNRKERCLPLIVLRQADMEYLRSAKISLNHIYPAGEHVRLQNGCDFEVGGERVRILIDDIPLRTRNMFLKAIKALGLRFGGIDYISPDIKKDYRKMKTAINEINSSPHQDVHYFDSTPHDNYSARRIIQKIFE